MLTNLIRISCLFSFFLFMTSCAEDEVVESNLNIDNERTAGERGGGNNNGNGNNGNGNGNNGNNNNQNGDVKVVEDWIDLFLELDRYATGMRPNGIARAVAYINLAAYEVVAPLSRNLLSNSGRLPDFELDVDSDLPPINKNLALNKAYAMVINHFILNLPSNQRAKITDLEETMRERYSRNVGNSLVDASEDFGKNIALQVIAYSQTDAAAEVQILDPQPTSYVPPTGAGFWTFSAEPERALFPYWESVRTFIVDANAVSTIQPITYSEATQSDYYAQMMETYNSNNEALAEDGEDLWIAEFWSDDVEGLMMSPPGRQISIAKQLIDKERLSLNRSLELMLKVSLSLNDAAVATWKYKYEYMVMRPSVYIQSYIDVDYQTNLFRLIPWPNPTFPGYPSGHSAFASAAAGVFIDFFGNNINFTDRTHQGRTEFRGQPRTFNTFTKMAEENAYSRIPLGVHIRMDCDEGIRLGYEISDAINEYDLKPPNS